MTWKSWVNIIVPGLKYVDEIGTWRAFKVGNNEKIVLVINVHVTLYSFGAGQYISKAQCDRKRGVKNAKHHRQQILHDIVEYIKKIERVNDILLIDNINQDVY